MMFWTDLETFFKSRFKSATIRARVFAQQKRARRERIDNDPMFAEDHKKIDLVPSRRLALFVKKL